MSEKIEVPRRKISDEEYNQAWADPSIRNLLRTIISTYRDIDYDSRQGISMIALWKALQYHRPEFGTKFTSSLVRFLHWEARRELRRIGRQRRFSSRSDETVDVVDWYSEEEEEERRDVGEWVRECMDELPKSWQKQILRMYYLEGLSLVKIGERRGHGREKARVLLHKAEDALAEILIERSRNAGLDWASR